MAVVLFVDDEIAILQALRRLLRRDPHEVLLAQSGAEALAILEERPVDAIVSDMRMPEMSGVELLSIVRVRHPSTVRIALTGQTDAESLVKLGADAAPCCSLQKPVTRQELLSVLAAVCVSPIGCK